MNPHTMLKRLIPLLLVLLMLPCLAGALGDYDESAMDAYCDAWSSYYDTGNEHIKLDYAVSLTVYAHGDADLYRSGRKDSIGELLLADQSPATYCVKAEASFSSDKFEFTLFDEYLTEIPKALSISANGKTLTGKYFLYTPSGKSHSLHTFTFQSDDIMTLLDNLLTGGSATFQITSSEGEYSVKVSKSTAPKLVRLMKHARDGRWYGHPDSSRYRDASLLPSGSASTPKPTAKPTTKPTAKPTPKPTAKSNVPSALQGVFLSEGDAGGQVKLVKLRMQELGYYRPGADVDGNFNSLMTERLKQFQANNGLSQTGIVDSRTLEKLYSAYPVKGQFYVAPTPTPRPEGRYMLIIPQNGYGQWQNVSGDKLKMRVKVTNDSRYRTVKAFELYIYTEDAWGDRDPETGRVYTSTTTRDVKPGATIYSDYFVIPHRKDIFRVHVGVKQMRYDDGSIESIPDSDIEYFYWEP